MRRIGLVVSSLISVGLLLGAARALAADVTEPTEVRKVDFKVAPKTLLRPLLTPAKATREGKLDDRLIRPHRSYDASAGLVG